MRLVRHCATTRSRVITSADARAVGVELAARPRGPSRRARRGCRRGACRPAPTPRPRGGPSCSAPRRAPTGRTRTWKISRPETSPPIVFMPPPPPLRDGAGTAGGAGAAAGTRGGAGARAPRRGPTCSTNSTPDAAGSVRARDGRLRGPPPRPRGSARGPRSRSRAGRTRASISSSRRRAGRDRSMKTPRSPRSIMNRSSRAPAIATVAALDEGDADLPESGLGGKPFRRRRRCHLLHREGPRVEGSSLHLAPGCVNAHAAGAPSLTPSRAVCLNPGQITRGK